MLEGGGIDVHVGGRKSLYTRFGTPSINYVWVHYTHLYISANNLGRWSLAAQPVARYVACCYMTLCM